MLIEELIRLGRPLLEDDSDPQQVLRLITGVEDMRVKNFFRHVFVIARHGAGEFYELAEGGREDRIGQMDDGRSIVPNYQRIAEAVWSAKVEEGRQAGSRTGTCSFTGVEGEVVSAYCKAWPWAFP